MAASPALPSRRVLGDQSTNAYLRRFHDRHNMTTTARAPGMDSWAEPRLGSGGMRFQKQDDIKGPKIGQKRSIAWVDGVDEGGSQGTRGVLVRNYKSEEGRTALKRGGEGECTAKVTGALKDEEEKDGKPGTDCEMKDRLERHGDCKSEIDPESMFAVQEKSDTGLECDIKPAPKQGDVGRPDSRRDVRPAPVKGEEDAPEPSTTRPQAMIIALGDEDGDEMPRKEEPVLTKMSSIESDPTPMTNTFLTSFHASQERIQTPEEQFDIQDEASQKTLEKLNMTPLPQIVSEPEAQRVPRLPTEGSQDSVGMSSFIDFDGQAGQPGQPLQSDQNVQDDVKELAPIHSLPWYTGSASERKDKVDSAAAKLLLRLRLAAYRVKTNQINTPFDQLLTPAQLRQETEATAAKPSQARVEGEEAGIQATKGESAESESETPKVRRVDSPSLPPVHPFATSARYSIVPDETLRREGKKKVLSSSSPPPSDTSSSTVLAESTTSHDEQLESRKTPFMEVADMNFTEGITEQPRNTAGPSTRLSGSDVGMVGAGDGPVGSQSKHDPRRDENGTGSSAVDGDAANRLLELIRAAIDY